MIKAVVLAAAVIVTVAGPAITILLMRSGAEAEPVWVSAAVRTVVDVPPLPSTTDTVPRASPGVSWVKFRIRIK